MRKQFGRRHFADSTKRSAMTDHEPKCTVAPRHGAAEIGESPLFFRTRREGLTQAGRLMEEAQVPADAEDDDLLGEVPAAEKCRAIVLHPQTASWFGRKEAKPNAPCRRLFRSPVGRGAVMAGSDITT